MMNIYEERYRQSEGYYWGNVPSRICYRVLELMPPTEPLRLLDIGCGEGRNAVFFARNGYHVTAFDLSRTGMKKTLQMAKEAGVEIEAFRADINTYRLAKHYDILFATGVLHYIPRDLRSEVFARYRSHTSKDGLHVFSVFVEKPFIQPPPEEEPNAHVWISGELFTHYRDWKVEYCTEEIIDCDSSGVPHRHAVNRVIARNVCPATRQ